MYSLKELKRIKRKEIKRNYQQNVADLWAARAEIKYLWALLVPLPGLLRRLADNASKRADDFVCRADGDAARALALRIEEAQR